MRTEPAAENGPTWKLRQRNSDKAGAETHENQRGVGDSVAFLHHLPRVEIKLGGWRYVRRALGCYLELGCRSLQSTLDLIRTIEV